MARSELEPRSVSVDVAAKACGVAPNTFRKHVLPHVDTVRIGERVLVLVASLDAWLESNARGAEPNAQRVTRSNSATSAPLTAVESAARAAELNARLRRRR